MAKTQLNSLRFALLFFAFLLAGLFCQGARNSAENHVSLADQLRYLPSGNFLKGATLAYDSVVADLLWIKAIAYFGDQYSSEHDYSWLFYILDTVTTLDPYFEDPYEFGGVVLANVVGDLDKSSFLLHKGMKNVSTNHPRYWYLPFFLAFNYWYYQNDLKTGAKYLEQAAFYPEAPSYLPLLTARMYADASSAEMALPFLDEMIKSARNPERRTALEQRKKEVLVNRDLDMLDQAVLKYKELFNKYPASLDELVTKGIIKQIPDEPFGGQYYYDLILQQVLSTVSKRIKIHERKIFK